MGDRAKILVVEDGDPLVRMLCAVLGDAGYEVTTASTGLEAIQQMVQQEFAVILLDLGLPDMDGKEVIAQACVVSTAPVLVISGRDSEKEKIEALDLGASDFVAKPFSAGELLARIRVALRASHPGAPEIGGKRPRLQLDVASRRALVEGRPVRLSRKETQFLQLLAEARGKIVSHDAIIEAIWGRSDADFMSVRVLAWQVRRKIELGGGAPRFLIAEAGEGYRLNMD